MESKEITTVGGEKVATQQNRCKLYSMVLGSKIPNVTIHESYSFGTSRSSGNRFLAIDHNWIIEEVLQPGDTTVIKSNK